MVRVVMAGPIEETNTSKLTHSFLRDVFIIDPLYHVLSADAMAFQADNTESSLYSFCPFFWFLSEPGAVKLL